MTKDCWHQIGVMGDRTCAELEKFIDCRHCPIYSAAGQHLPELEATGEYGKQQTKNLAPVTTSVLIFRLGVEWFGLSAKLFREVTQPRKIHTVPHRSNKIFLGVVNVGGELLLCISMKHLLGLDNAEAMPKSSGKNLNLSPVIYQRMVVIAKAENSWVFSADEIYGIEPINWQAELRPVTAFELKSNGVYTQSIIPWKDRWLNILDDDLLFYTLERRVL